MAFITKAEGIAYVVDGHALGKHFLDTSIF